MINILLINCDNNFKGLGIQGRRLKQIFDKYIPECNFKIYSIPWGSAAYKIDKNFKNNFELKKYILKYDYIITIELFMPNIYEFCNDHRIKTIWIPNKEWTPIEDNIIKKFPSVWTIMPTNKGCYDFMRSKFNLKNLVLNTIAFDLPVINKEPQDDYITYFIHNAGLRGVGDRRNTALVCSVMEDILMERKDIVFYLKSMTNCPINNLKNFDRFRYINKKIDLETNMGLYASADFSIAPSKWEGNGFAIIESLHYGTPTITSNYPPMNEWIEHKKTGYLVNGNIDQNIKLPLPLHSGDRAKGIGWSLEFKIDKEDLKQGIYWLADNKYEIYNTFNKINKRILKSRLKRYIKIWKKIFN